MGVYCVSKHAVVTLTECLYHDLQARGAKIGVSLLCPAYVPTGIADSERNRPAALHNPPRPRSPEDLEREQMMRHAVESGRIKPDDVAEMVFDAIVRERFYILTHPRIKGAVEARVQDIIEDRNPTDTSRPAKAQKS
jgi:NAD(P)-dependent dehydrogenase (short-subunit alcohol dehydrogenase family)